MSCSIGIGSRRASFVIVHVQQTAQLRRIDGLLLFETTQHPDVSKVLTVVL